MVADPEAGRAGVLMTSTADKNIPVPGMAATRYISKSEWQAGTVIRVHPGQKKLVWQRNTAVLVRENGKTHYEFVENPDGECFEFSIRKSGHWAMVGKLTDKRELVLGVRAENSPAAQQAVAPENPGYHAEVPKIPGVHKEAIYDLWISKGRCPSQDTVHVTTKKEKPAGGKYTYAGEVRARSAQVAKSIARVWALRDSYLGKYLPEDI